MPVCTNTYNYVVSAASSHHTQPCAMSQPRGVCILCTIGGLTLAAQWQHGVYFTNNWHPNVPKKNKKKCLFPPQMPKTFSIWRGNSGPPGVLSQGPRWARTWPLQRLGSGPLGWVQKESFKRWLLETFRPSHLNQQGVVACSGSRSHPFGRGTSFHARRLAKIAQIPPIRMGNVGNMEGIAS